MKGNSKNVKNLKDTTKDTSKSLSEKGSIRFDSIPGGASFYLENKLIGKSPLDITNINPGTYRYKLIFNNKEYVETLPVYPGKTTYIKYDFELKKKEEKYLDIVNKLHTLQTQKPKQNEPMSAILEKHLADMNKILEKNNAVLENINYNTLTNISKVRWYDVETKILRSVASQPEDPSSGEYQFEKIHDVLEYNSKSIHVCNDGPGILYVVTSNDGHNFSPDETIIYEGECKEFTNIYTIGLRSPTQGLTYRASERHIEPHASAVFSAVRYKDRRDRKGVIVFQDDYESPTVKYTFAGAAPPSTVTRSTDTAYFGDFSVKMNNGNANNTMFIEYTHSDIHRGRIGIQISFAIQNLPPVFQIAIEIAHFSDGVQHFGEIFVDTNNDLGYIDIHGVSHILFTNAFTAPILSSSRMWNNLKVVFDFGQNTIDYVIINAERFNFSIPLTTTTPTLADNILQVFITTITGAVAPALIYVDNYILTEDEPVIL